MTGFCTVEKMVNKRSNRKFVAVWFGIGLHVRARARTHTHTHTHTHARMCMCTCTRTHVQAHSSLSRPFNCHCLFSPH